MVSAFCPGGARPRQDDCSEPIAAGIGSIPQVYLARPEAERCLVREEAKGAAFIIRVWGRLLLSLEMLIGVGTDLL